MIPVSSAVTTAADRLGPLRGLRDSVAAAPRIPALVGDSAAMMAAPDATNTTNPNRLSTLEQLRQEVSLRISRPVRQMQEPLRRFLGEIPLPQAPPDVPRELLPFSWLYQGPTTEHTLKTAYDNITTGLALGSVVIPDDFSVGTQDIANDPMPALRTASMFAGAAAEGFLGDIGILRLLGLTKATAAARGFGRLERSADAALDLFGQGQDASVFRQILGGAALGGVSEATMQAIALKDPITILSNAGLVTLGGATLGGAVASTGAARRALLPAPRPLEPLATGFAQRAAPEIQTAQAAGEPVEQIAARVAGRTGENQAEFVAAIGRATDADAGLTPNLAYVQRLEDAARARAAGRRLGEEGVVGLRDNKVSESVAKLNDARMEGMFDQSSAEGFLAKIGRGWSKTVQGFKDSFDYETRLKRFPALSGVAGVTLADDFRVLAHGTNRVARIAEKELNGIIGPILSFKGRDTGTAFESFRRIVVLRDLAESGERGLILPEGYTLEGIKTELSRLENSANPEIMQAAENHRQVVGEMRNQLIARGRLKVDDGFQNYFPHRVIEDLSAEQARILGRPNDVIYPTSAVLTTGALREPRRPYTMRREGSRKAISTDYLGAMERAITRFHLDNLTEDFLLEIGRSPLNLQRADLAPEELRSLATRRSFVRGTETFKRFLPRGPAFYRTEAVTSKFWDDLEAFLADGGTSLDEFAPNVEGLKEIVAVGRPKEYILPADLADRLEQFYAPDPLAAQGAGISNAARKATAWWKRNTIHWGLNRFFMFQVAGDSINLLRSNPAAFLQVRNGKLESPVVQAINEQFKQFGTPVMSKEQMFGSLVGGAAFGAVGEALNGDTDQPLSRKIATILTGAGLGYISGTYRKRGTLPIHSSMYELADDLGVINTGLTAGSEDLARRVLGAGANYRLGEGTPAARRAFDTITTLAFGKPFGNPWSVADVPARIVGVIQRERENTLRFANYIQRISQGTPNEVAAKAAREDLVDYGKFTEFEDKVLRGFWLPFYAFTRHNIPNWLKTPATKVGAAAVGGLAAIDIAAQVWNEQFFPEIERGLRGVRKENFHVIVGDPNTGEAYTNEAGDPMVVGWEMPYEQALEVLGVARPGMVYSAMFGLGGEDQEVSLLDRARRTSRAALRMKAGPGKLALELLGPFIKEPIQVYFNHDFFWDAPIVPERYFETGDAKAAMLRHVAETAFRQLREFQVLGGTIQDRRFNPINSPIGLGLPINYVDMDRQVQGFLFEEMDAASQTVQRADNRWRQKIDDIIYERPMFSDVAEGEHIEVWEEINALPNMSTYDISQAWNYYMDRGGKGTIMRRYQSLTIEERYQLSQQMDPWAASMLMLYLNGGAVDDYIAPSAGGPTVTGN